MISFGGLDGISPIGSPNKLTWGVLGGLRLSLGMRATFVELTTSLAQARALAWDRVLVLVAWEAGMGSPRSAEAYCQRAFAHQQSQAEGRTEKAFADVSKAIEFNPSMPLAYILRGSAYSDQREFSAAVTDFSRAIELNSRSYSGYGGRAAAFASLGDFAKARRDVEKAMSLKPPQNDLKQLIRIRDSLPDQPR